MEPCKNIQVNVIKEINDVHSEAITDTCKIS